MSSEDQPETPMTRTTQTGTPQDASTLKAEQTNDECFVPTTMHGSAAKRKGKDFLGGKDPC